MNFKIIFVVFAITFAFTIIFTKRLIPLLKKKKMGQKILEIGPSWHKEKEGTPTMGGIGFFVASLISLLVVAIIFGRDIENRELICILNVFFYGTLNFLVGLIDDISKLRKRKNEGLTPKQKLIFQGVNSAVFLLLMKFSVGISTVLKIPFTNWELDVGFSYYLFALILLCGIVNSVNLTDGVDGLASTCVLTVGVLFICMGAVKLDSTAISFFGAILIGAALGFLLFNVHPARIFMGDTGSLFFGGIIVGASFAMDNPMIAVLYSFVFIIEALSDILQVCYFKITKGKRLFKMAPLHHHFEKCGLSEMKIVSIFGVATVLFCIAAYLGYRI